MGDMLFCMRTTLNLPDPLMREVKAEAAREGITLTQLVTEALEQRVRGHNSRPEPLQIRPFRGGSGMRPGVDLSDNAATLDLLDRLDHE